MKERRKSRSAIKWTGKERRVSETKDDKVDLYVNALVIISLVVFLSSFLYITIFK